VVFRPLWIKLDGRLRASMDAAQPRLLQSGCNEQDSHQEKRHLIQQSKVLHNDLSI
jgi:hypothetical protein